MNAGSRIDQLSMTGTYTDVTAVHAAVWASSQPTGRGARLVAAVSPRSFLRGA